MARPTPEPSIPASSIGACATGKPAGIRKAAEFFGLAYETQNGQIIHNLRTALLDADGKIAEFYSDNQWKPADLAARVAALEK